MSSKIVNSLIKRMSEQDNSSQNSTAIMIFIVFLAVLIPWLLNEYVKEYYVYAWYWLTYLKFTIIYWITEVPYIGDNASAIFFWRDWFLIGKTIPDTQFYPLLNQVYGILVDVDTSSVAAVRSDFIDNKELNGQFKSIGQLGVALYFPLYLYVVVKQVYKLLTVNFYNTVFTLDQFAETLAEGFPELLPVVYANPLKQNIDKGDWRMSPKIFAYLKEHDCIVEYVEDGVEMFRLDEDNLGSLLVEQLGEKWMGFDALDQNYRTLAAVSLPMIYSPAEGKRETYELIEALGFAYSSKPKFLKCLGNGLRASINFINPAFYLGTKNGRKMREATFKSIHWILIGYRETKRQKRYRKISNSMIESNLKKYKDCDKVKDILKGHAYNTTVISRLIEEARLGGVLPSCSCIWLKVEDRKLFYVFNNLGRYVSWIEVVGFWSHYINEKKIKAPFPYPKIENGIEGIDDALWASFNNYSPLEDRG